MENKSNNRLSRRDAIRWMVTASASTMLLRSDAFGVDSDGASGQPPTLSHPNAAAAQTISTATGYGTDPDLMKVYKPGDVWPLTFTDAQRKTATALCDVIIPADDQSPSASQVHVVDFIDEWISAPYPGHEQDRQTILDGFGWLDQESTRRFQKPFISLADDEKSAICDDIAYVGTAKKEYSVAAHFFTRYRNLTAGGFYTTPEGMKDLKYIGNVARPAFEGPPPEALRKAGLL